MNDASPRIAEEVDAAHAQEPTTSPRWKSTREGTETRRNDMKLPAWPDGQQMDSSGTHCEPE